jgi:hypothetical protein
VSTVYSIFRVCLATPDNPVTGAHSCTGTPAAKNAKATSASTGAFTGGGAGDMATLAGFLGV